MKKSILFLLIISILILSCSCSKKTGTQIIYELDSSWLSENSFEKDTALIETAPKTYVEKDLALTQKQKILGKELSINYQDTSFYPIGDMIIRRYTCENGLNVYLTESGSVFGLTNGTLFTLDIKPNDNSSTVRTILEEKISVLADVKEYDSCKISRSNPDDMENFGMYTFRWEKHYDDFVISYIQVIVKDDGSVENFFQDPSDVDKRLEDITIDQNKINKIILKKICDTYQKSAEEICEFRNITSPKLSIYKDELCAIYNLSVVFNSTNETGENDRGTISLLIPIDEI